MALLLNIVALALVILISWVGMLWLAGRVHRAVDRDGDDPDGWQRPCDEPCPECRGVGALRKGGAVLPCPSCDGTGVS